jgi:hypothetical protein
MLPTKKTIFGEKREHCLFRSEIATWIQKWFKISAGKLLESPVYRALLVFQGRDDGRGYRNMCKIPQGPNLNEIH